MKVALAASGPPVEPPPALALAVLADLLVAVAFVVAAVVTFLRGTFEEAWPPFALAAYGVALLVADLAVARMKPRGLTWRRRLGYLAIGAIAWKGGPFRAASPWVVVLVIAWVGTIWIALVLGGRALSRAIAGSTGEEHPA